MEMYKDLEKILLNEDEISEIIKRLGEEITKDYKDKNLLLVSVLRGAVVFLTDLMRAIDLPLEIDFMAASSYGKSTATSGVVKVKLDIAEDLSGYDVLIVEDILDSGVTLSKITSMLESRGANSVRICTFLDKPERHIANIKADYVGSVVPNEFVVGYGLDYADKYRNLPVLGVLKREIYE